MNSFVNFLRSERRQLIANTFLIVTLVPILVTVIIIFAAWLTLRLKGIELSIGKLMGVLPTIFAVALVSMLGTLINMVVNEWQKYRKRRLQTTE